MWNVIRGMNRRQSYKYLEQFDKVYGGKEDEMIYRAKEKTEVDEIEPFKSYNSPGDNGITKGMLKTTEEIAQWLY